MSLSTRTETKSLLAARYSVDSRSPFTVRCAVKGESMGIKLVNLASEMAKSVGFPEATAAVFARFGRGAGLLTSGARGRHVPDAKSLDASRLLIGMMLDAAPSRFVGIVRDFGRLEALESLSAHGTPGEITRDLFPPRQPFDVSIARILDGLASPDFVSKVRTLAREFGQKAEEPTVMFPIDIHIDRSWMQAEIHFADAGITFGHPALHDDQFTAAVEASRPYQTAIKATFRIEIDVLTAVASILRGVHFDTLLEAADRSAGISVGHGNPIDEGATEPERDENASASAVGTHEGVGPRSLAEGGET